MGLYLLTITVGTVQWSRGEWHRSSFKRFAYFKIKVGYAVHPQKTSQMSSMDSLELNGTSVEEWSIPIFSHENRHIDTLSIGRFSCEIWVIIPSWKPCDA